MLQVMGQTKPGVKRIKYLQTGLSPLIDMVTKLHGEQDHVPATIDFTWKLVFLPVV